MEKSSWKNNRSLRVCPLTSVWNDVKKSWRAIDTQTSTAWIIRLCVFQIKKGVDGQYRPCPSQTKFVKHFPMKFREGKERRKFCTTWINNRNQIPGRHQKWPKYRSNAFTRQQLTHDAMTSSSSLSSLRLSFSVLKSLKAHHKHVGREIEFEFSVENRDWRGKWMNSDHSTLDRNKSIFLNVGRYMKWGSTKKLSWWRSELFFYQFFRGSSSCPYLIFFPRLLRQANRSVTTTSKVQRHTHSHTHTQPWHRSPV